MSDDGPVFPAAPPERIELDVGAVLVRCRVDLAEPVVQAINESRDHLAPWMAWAAEPATVAALSVFFAGAQELWDRRRDFSYSVLLGDATGEPQVLGGCGLHGRQGGDALDIGYWLHVDHVGRGIATASARALTDAAFALEGIQRVRIQCAEHNDRSALVPARLGYRFDGLSEPKDELGPRLATQDWIMDKATWVAAAAEGSS